MTSVADRTMKKYVTAERLRELLRYSPETGQFHWREMPRGGAVSAGQIAGSLGKNGYRYIGLDGRKYLAHRLVWLYVHGEFPAGILDHRDTDRDNNRLANLRPATYVENGHNSHGCKAGSASGIRGVYKHRTGKWVARLMTNRKYKHLGVFCSKEEAEAAYLAEKRAVHPFASMEASNGRCN